MTVFNGKSVCGAAVCADVCVIRKPVLSAERVPVEDADAELRRMAMARHIAARQLQEIYDRALDRFGESNAQIFGIHMMMLEDEDYNGSIDGIIEAENVSAEYAVSRTSEIFSQMLEAMDNEYMRARSADVRDVSYRLMSILRGRADDMSGVPEHAVICADDISPSQAEALDHRSPAAFVMAHGSTLSHTAILARSMNIPVIIGAGDGFLERVRSGEQALVDGSTGEIILEPDSAARSRLAPDIRTVAPAEEKTCTIDGTRVMLLAEGASGALPAFADGTAFLACPRLDDGGEQYEYYRSIMENAAGGRVFLRVPEIPASDPERQKNVLKHLRSVFRAVGKTDSAGILFPMINCAAEARKILKACDEVTTSLRAEGCEVSDNVKLGFMLETPAAAIICDVLAPMSDLFIIDSDVLARLTLSSSGGGIFEEEFYESQKSAVLRLISHSARSAVKNGARIGICGTLAQDSSLTEEFLRMGINKFCVPAGKIEEIRGVIANIDLAE